VTQTITYSLRLTGRDSDEYYRSIAAFADRWLAEARLAAAGEIAGFRAFRQQAGQAPRSEAELAFELLALGVLLREHGAEAAAFPAWAARLQGALLQAQERCPRLERPAKVARGLAGFIARARRGGAPVPSLDHLLGWLRAHGEAGRAGRLAQWQDYLAAAGPRQAEQAILRCLALAADFAEDSLLDLGAHTARVPGFLAEEARQGAWRYDAELRSRSRLEYHLGMLGTEILNRAYRPRFLAAGRKVVILPPCMRARPEEACQATPTRFGARCQACTPGCRVHQITRLGEKRGFEVYIIPDELRVFGPGTAGGGLGLVGVSCVLTNWSGGWEADALGLPAQGVLLDYVGCHYHWHEKGIPTDTNLGQLRAVLGM
jgi:hypothetical protein